MGVQEKNQTNPKKHSFAKKKRMQQKKRTQTANLASTKLLKIKKDYVFQYEFAIQKVCSFLNNQDRTMFLVCTKVLSRHALKQLVYTFKEHDLHLIRCTPSILSHSVKSLEYLWPPGDLMTPHSIPSTLLSLTLETNCFFPFLFSDKVLPLSLRSFDCTISPKHKYTVFLCPTSFPSRLQHLTLCNMQLEIPRNTQVFPTSLKSLCLVCHKSFFYDCTDLFNLDSLTLSFHLAFQTWWRFPDSLTKLVLRCRSAIFLDQKLCQLPSFLLHFECDFIARTFIFPPMLQSLICEDYWGSCESLPTSVIHLRLTTKSSLAVPDFCSHLTQLHILEWHRQHAQKLASLAPATLTLITSPRSLVWFQLHHVQKIALYPDACPLNYTISDVFPLQAPNLRQFRCFFVTKWDDLCCWMGIQATKNSQETREMLSFPCISNIQQRPMLSYQCSSCIRKTKPRIMDQIEKVHCIICQKAVCTTCIKLDSLLCKLCRRRQRSFFAK